MFPFILLLLDVSNSGKGSLETCYQRTHTQAQMDGLFKHVSCFTAGQQQICQEWAQKSSTIFLFLFFFFFSHSLSKIDSPRIPELQVVCE